MKLISNTLIFPALQYGSRATYIEGYHYASNPNNETINAQPVNVLCLQDVALLGIGYVVENKNWLPVFNFEDKGLPFFPDYVEILSPTWKGRPSIFDLLKAGKGNLNCIKVDTVISVLHYNCSVYGHLLLEILPKIFVLKTFFEKDGNLLAPPIALPTTIKEWVKNYILEVWPECKFLWFDPYKEYVSAGVTFVVAGIEMQQHPDIANYFIDFAKTNTSTPKKLKNFSQELKQYLRFGNIYNSKNRGRKIVLARPKGHRRQQIKNFANLEKIAIGKGYKVVEPSEFGSLKKQALFFSQCSVVLGEYTSAMHNTIFCPSGTFVGCINYRNHYQQSIASVIGHNLNYLIPEQGSLTWGSKESYTVSEAKFSRLIDDIENNMNQS